MNHKSTDIRKVLALGLFLPVLTAPAFAQDSENLHVGEMTLRSEDAEQFRGQGYSRYAGRGFPTQVYWGDTHLHTNLSLDARAFGVLLGPEEAFRLARGEDVIATHGERVQLSRPQKSSFSALQALLSS